MCLTELKENKCCAPKTYSYLNEFKDVHFMCRVVVQKYVWGIGATRPITERYLFSFLGCIFVCVC